MCNPGVGDSFPDRRGNSCLGWPGLLPVGLLFLPGPQSRDEREGTGEGFCDWLEGGADNEDVLAFQVFYLSFLYCWIIKYLCSRNSIERVI